MKTLLQKLINELRCPACSCQMSPPLLRGASGRTYCRKCRDKQWCFPVRTTGRIRNYSFEKLCFDVILKCSFASAGCHFTGIGIRVASHEKSCDFSKSSCILKASSNCEWVGFKNKLKRHCESAHPDQFVQEHTSYWTTDYSHGTYIGIIFAHDTLFRFALDFCAKTLKGYFSLVYLGQPFSSYKFIYELTLINKYGMIEEVCVFHRKCLHISLNPKPFKRNNVVSVPLTTIKEFSMNTEWLIFKIDISKNDLEDLKEETSIVEDRLGLSVEDAIIAELQCPVCYICISPPILGCVNGHHFCRDCFNLVSHCPLCRDKKALSSNVIMERLHTLVNVPCKNAISGCAFRGKGPFLVQHESSCFVPK